MPVEPEEPGMPPMMPGDEGSGKGTNSFTLLIFTLHNYTHLVFGFENVSF